MSPSRCGPVTTGRFVAHPWYCDANAHLNTRFIQGFFDDATQHLLALCGHGNSGDKAGIGVVDVRCAIDYKAEVAPGTLVIVTSAFNALGRKSFTTVHEMRSVDGATIFAGCETVSVFFDLCARTAAPIADHFRAQAMQHLTTAAA